MQGCQNNFRDKHMSSNIGMKNFWSKNLNGKTMNNQKIMIERTMIFITKKPFKFEGGVFEIFDHWAKYEKSITY